MIITRTLEKVEKQHPLQSYTNRKCIIVISVNTYFTYKFLCNFIQQKSKSALSEEFWKKYDYSTPQQVMPAKFISMLSFKASTLQAKLCDRIQDRTIARIFGKM